MSNETIIVQATSKINNILSYGISKNVSNVLLLKYIYSFIDEGLAISNEDLKELNSIINYLYSIEAQLSKIRTGGNYINDYYSTLRFGSINLPPLFIGDNEKTIGQTDTIVFTSSHFIDSTNPLYFDAEGDQALNLKILSLPEKGNLYYNGNLVYVNQIIPFTEIDNELLTYTADITNMSETLTFEFAISDSGSGKFTK